jgi:hypothetical protein
VLELRTRDNGAARGYNRAGARLDFWTAQLPGDAANGPRARFRRCKFRSCLAASRTLVSAQDARGCDGSRECWKYRGVLDSLLAPRLAEAFGWKNVFGFALVPAFLVLVFYAAVSKEAPGGVKQKKVSDYLTLLKDPDAHWFCFYYTISFGGFVGLASS